MAEGQIDFWFTMGSTYSYLSVMRLADVERSTGASFRWRPFHLLLILQEMKHVPFADKPAKMSYMWRDLERRAAMYGLPVKLPAPYPAKQSVMANLVAIVGMGEGWGADFVRAAYRRWLQAGRGNRQRAQSVLKPARDRAGSRTRALTGECGRGQRSHGERNRGCQTAGDFRLADLRRRR